MNKIIIEHVEPPSNSERLNKILLELDEVIIPRLSNRVNISGYACKLAERADLFYIKNGKTDIGNCAIYFNNGKTGFISSIAIRKEWQKKGLGKEMWVSILKQAKKKEIATIELMVDKNNISAIEFYIKLGFVRKKFENSWINMCYQIEETGR